MQIKEAFKEDVEELNQINEKINRLINLPENVTDEDAKEHIVNQIEELKIRLEQVKIRVLATEMYIVKKIKWNSNTGVHKIDLPEELKKRFGTIKTYANVRLEQIEQEVKKRKTETNDKIDFKTTYKCREDGLDKEYPEFLQLRKKPIKKGIENLEEINKQIIKTEKNIKNEDNDMEK